MKNKSELQRTFVLVKPDGIARGLTGEILSRFERKGLVIVEARMMLATKEMAEEHYAEHKGDKSYFGIMTNALLGGPVLAIVLEAENAIMAARQIIGTADPFHSSVGTIRGDYAIKKGENLIHGADSYSAVLHEIEIWFGSSALANPNFKAKQAAVNVGPTWGPPKKVAPKKHYGYVTKKWQPVTGSAVAYAEAANHAAEFGAFPANSAAASPAPKITAYDLQQTGVKIKAHDSIAPGVVYVSPMNSVGYVNNEDYNMILAGEPITLQKI